MAFTPDMRKKLLEQAALIRVAALTLGRFSYNTMQVDDVIRKLKEDEEDLIGVCLQHAGVSKKDIVCIRLELNKDSYRGTYAELVAYRQATLEDAAQLKREERQADEDRRLKALRWLKEYQAKYGDSK